MKIYKLLTLWNNTKGDNDYHIAGGGKPVTELFNKEMPRMLTPSIDICVCVFCLSVCVFFGIKQA